MIALVIAMLLTSPAPLKRCASACLERAGLLQCFYDDQRTCTRAQFECLDTAEVWCVPRVVNLGTWDPRPAPSDPMTTYTLSPPRDSTLTPMGP